MQVYTENGIEFRHDETPDGWIDIDTYHPHSCPWDYYGRKHLAEVQHYFQSVNIECKPLTTHKRKLYPMGTGAGGSVRFGDDMLPGVYRVAVKADDEAIGRQALADMQSAIHNWLHCNGEMPSFIL